MSLRERSLPTGPAVAPVAPSLLLAERLPDGVALTDLAGTVLWSNPALCALVGVDADQLLGRDLGRWSTPESAGARHARLGAVAEGKVVHASGEAITRPDGAVVAVEVDSAPVEVGGHRCALSVLRDAGEGMAGVAALRAASARLAQTFLSATTGRALISPDGRVLTVNPALSRTLRWSAEELEGTIWTDLSDPDDAEAEAGLHRELMEGAVDRYRFEKRMACGDGGVVWAAAQVSVVRDSGGEPEYLIHQIDDVTDRRNRDEQLRLLSEALEASNDLLTDAVRRSSANEARYRALADHLPDTVALVVDRGGLVTMASGAGTTARRRVPADLVGRTLDESLGTTDPELLGALAERAFAGEASSTEMRSEPGGVENLVDVVPLAAVAGREPAEILVVARDLGRVKQRARELAAAEARWRAAFHDAPVGMLEIDRDGVILQANQAAAELFEAGPAGLPGRAPADFIGGPGHEDGASVLAALWDGSPAPEVRLVGALGTVHWVAVRSSRLDGCADIPDRLLVHIVDVGEVREQRLRTEATQARFAALLERSSDAILLLDRDLRVIYASPGSSQLCGAALGDGVSFVDLLHAGDQSEVADRLGGIGGSPGGSTVLQCRFRAGNGAWRHAEATAVNRLEDGAVAGIVVNARDVTERVEAAARLAHQATHDPLTGLPNRALLLDRMHGSIERSRRRGLHCAAVFLDLDGFKQVNDSLGHAIGDEVLRQVAARIVGAIRPGDSAARLGGDEFVVLAEGVPDRGAAILIAERLADELRSPLAVGRHTFAVGASIGIALSDRHSPELLLQEADTAMYRAKAGGRNRWEVYDREMRTVARRRLQVEGLVRNAIDGDGLRLHYQPVVDLRSGGVYGTEALARIARPGGRLVSPDEFIPVAEDTGLIAPLGAAVLRDACAQAARWSLAGGPEQMCVNVSARELASADFVAQVDGTLDAFGVQPDALCLELTETAVIAAGSEAQRHLHQVRDLGVGLALDDFGTGWSSLANLRRFPFDCIKIDRSFVTGLGIDEGDTEVVRAVIELGRALRLTTVAEGVETVAQHELLISLGCDSGQGYLYGRPAPPDDLFVDVPA